MNLTQKLYRGVDVRALDALAMKQYKIPSIELMGRAGASAFKTIRQAWPLAKHFAVICGPGNNGGDGLMLAAMLHQDDFKVDVYLVGDVERPLSETAELAKIEFLKSGLPILPLPARLEHVDVIIDAVLGTGIRAPLEPDFKEAIALINRSERPVLAIDVPSGIDSDSGAIIEAAVKADLTLTFIGLKYALLTGRAVNYSGHILFDDLGLPPDIYEMKPWQGEIIELNQALKPFSARLPAAHKGDFGHVLILGGGKPGYAGAVVLAGLASMHGGSGLTSAVVHPDALTMMARAPVEMMCHPGDGDIDSVWDRASVLVIGPGLTQSEWAKKQWDRAKVSNLKMVVDADALKLLGHETLKKDNWILTPHPGEAAALLGRSIEAIESNRVESARAIQKKYGGIVILKGAGTVICSDQSQFYLCRDGNPGMATGGMGDVLSGLLGALVAQGLDLLDAAKLAVIIHAQAADLEQTMGERGMLASDLMLHIRSLINPTFNSESKTDASQFFNF